jgi:hypothetical protein
MPPRKLVFAAPLCLLVLLLVAACGGGDDDDSGPGGQLSDPNNVPTATPWTDVPEVIAIDPNNIQPLPPDGGGEDVTATPQPGEPGECGQTYTVEAGDTVFGIADKCGVDPQAIIDLNPDIDPGALSIGEILIMPNVPAETPVDPEEVVPEEEAEETEPAAEETTP